MSILNNPGSGQMERQKPRKWSFVWLSLIDMCPSAQALEQDIPTT